MASRLKLGVQIAAVLCLLVAGPSRGRADETAGVLLKEARNSFQPLPPDMATPSHPLSAARVELGRALFFDPRLSVDGTVSCATCHQPARYGADGLARSRGAHKRATARNAPSVLNAALAVKQGWRGDHDDVEAQARAALIDPTMFGQPSYAAAMARLKSIRGYLAMFARAFPDRAEPITPRRFGEAVGAFERTLVTPSRFDRYLTGDEAALSTHERRGLRKFLDNGCMDCHAGAGVGGSMLQRFGLAEEYWKQTGSRRIDKGRFALTHRRDDLYVFKVSSLRNVAMTAPYFHDGSVRRLEDAVRIMAKLQVGTALSAADIGDIVVFLNSLTGTPPDSFMTAPVLPSAS